MTLAAIIQLLGGLSLFIFGMKSLSEALQKMAGEKLKNLLASMTKNRFRGLLTGLITTMLIQSSSATTVMVITFVNAGLLTLLQSSGIIFGANIGTTFTAWIVSFFGFKMKINVLALFAIMVGGILMFIKSRRHKSLGDSFIGFGVLFLGLFFMKKSIPTADPASLDFIQSFTGSGMLSHIIFVIVGMIITVVVQSSSATIAITITMASMGWIDFPTSAAIVLGENIGTTVTAVIASIPGNRTAKKCAGIHVSVNVIGVIWALLLFPFLIILVDKIIPGKAGENIEFHISAFHSTFNIINTFVLIWFVPYILKVINMVVKDKEDKKELKYFHSALLKTSEIDMVVAEKEVKRMLKMTGEMILATRKVVNNPQIDIDEIDKVYKMENVIDEMENEISHYLSRLVSDSNSPRTAKEITELFSGAHDIERIADHLEAIAKITKRIRDNNVELSKVMLDEFNEFCDCLEEFSSKAEVMIEADAINMFDVRFYQKKISSINKTIKSNNLQRMSTEKTDIDAGVQFMNIIVHLKRISEHYINVCEGFNAISVS